MTGCERVLARLERGPATAAELYAETFTVVHSRISDLRRQGYVITCERTGGHDASSFLYTLADTPATTPSRGSGDRDPSPYIPGAFPDGGLAHEEPLLGQLSLVSA